MKSPRRRKSTANFGHLGQVKQKRKNQETAMIWNCMVLERVVVHTLSLKHEGWPSIHKNMDKT